MLVALAARVDAAPSDDSIALAVRYANLLTGAADPDDSDDVDDAHETAEEEADEADGARATDEADDIAVASDRDAGDRDAGDRDAGDRDDRQPDAYSRDGDARQLAMIDAEQAPTGVTATEDVNVAASSAGAVETYESWTRHPRPSRWGRLDLGLAWRRHWSEPMHARLQRTDEVWLVATWRR